MAEGGRGCYNHSSDYRAPWWVEPQVHLFDRITYAQVDLLPNPMAGSSIVGRCLAKPKGSASTCYHGSHFNEYMPITA